MTIKLGLYEYIHIFTAFMWKSIHHCSCKNCITQANSPLLSSLSTVNMSSWCYPLLSRDRRRRSICQFFGHQETVQTPKLKKKKQNQVYQLSICQVDVTPCYQETAEGGQFVSCLDIKRQIKCLNIRLKFSPILKLSVVFAVQSKIDETAKVKTIGNLLLLTLKD